MKHCRPIVVSCLLMLAVSLILPQGVEAATVDSATKAEIKTATDCYERGIKAMDAEKYTLALEQFQKSYETVSSPNSGMMVGRALVKLGRLPEAYRELTRAIADASSNTASYKRYRKTIETAQKELDDIKGKLAFVTLSQGAKVLLQGQVINAVDWNGPQPVTPGAISVEVTFTDGRQANKQLMLKAGEQFEFIVEPPPADAATPAPTAPTRDAPVKSPKDGEPSGMSRRTVGYLFGAVGIVGIGTFVGFGLIAAQRQLHSPIDDN